MSTYDQDIDERCVVGERLELVLSYRREAGEDSKVKRQWHHIAYILFQFPDRQLISQVLWYHLNILMYVHMSLCMSLT